MSGSSRGRAGEAGHAGDTGYGLVGEVRRDLAGAAVPDDPVGEAGCNRPVNFSGGVGGAHPPQKARTYGGRPGLTGNGRLRLALVSKSPAWLVTLQAAGFDPFVQVSDADEETLLESIRGGPAQKVLALVTAKARAVAYDVCEAVEADIVIGCDSMFEFGGEAVGKSGAPETARGRIARVAGRSGVLHMGHQMVHLESGALLGTVSHVVVHFAPMPDAEVETYAITGESSHVAGAFIVDELSGSFVERVGGDYHGVVGIPLPLLHAMLANWGVSITRLWQPPAKLASDADDEADVKPIPAGTVDASAFDGSAAGKPPYGGRLWKGVDGFILCLYGSEHRGLAGAVGILTFRERESIEVLVQLCAEWSYSDGTWPNPGGAIDWSGMPLEGTPREFEEEAAIGAGSLNVVGSIVRDHGDWRYTTFAARCETVEPVPNDESFAPEWAPPDDLLEGRLDRPVHPVFTENLPHLVKVIRDSL